MDIGLDMKLDILFDKKVESIISFSNLFCSAVSSMNYMFLKYVSNFETKNDSNCECSIISNQCLNEELANFLVSLSNFEVIYPEFLHQLIYQELSEGSYCEDLFEDEYLALLSRACISILGEEDKNIINLYTKIVKEVYSRPNL